MTTITLLTVTILTIYPSVLIKDRIVMPLANKYL